MMSRIGIVGPNIATTLSYKDSKIEMKILVRHQDCYKLLENSP